MARWMYPAWITPPTCVYCACAKLKTLGIIVSDNMVKARLEQMFSNPNDQKFSQDAYTGFLTQYRNAGLLGSGKGGKSSFRN